MLPSIVAAGVDMRFALLMGRHGEEGRCGEEAGVRGGEVCCCCELLAGYLALRVDAVRRCWMPWTRVLGRREWERGCAGREVGCMWVM
jgi:hypothetical protein